MRARDNRGGVVYDDGMLHVRHDGRAKAFTFTTFGREPAAVLSVAQANALITEMAAALNVTLYREP